MGTNCIGVDASALVDMMAMGMNSHHNVYVRRCHGDSVHVPH